MVIKCARIVLFMDKTCLGLGFSWLCENKLNKQLRVLYFLY